jgi:hypothetical protein
MTTMAATWAKSDTIRFIAASIVRGAALIAIAAILILVILPAALGAAGPDVPIVS